MESFSPDGTKLAVFQGSTLWLLAYPGGAAREVRSPDHPELSFVSWMPDSRHFVTARLRDGQGIGLSMVNSETGTSRLILSSPLLTIYPTVSPDGKRLAFVTGDARWKLVEVTLADGRVRELGTGSRASMYPSLSPDGTRLAFMGGSRFDSIISEMTLTAAGTGATRTLTAVEGHGIEHVQWSPDGARILFAALGPAISLMVAPASGGRALRVDSDAPMTRGGVWSPDGTRIAYRREVGGEHQIVTVRVGTSAAPDVIKRWSIKDPMRLPLAWSPDAQWILTRQFGNLSLMAADGSSERHLFTTTGLLSLRGPSSRATGAKCFSYAVISRRPAVYGSSSPQTSSQARSA